MSLVQRNTGSVEKKTAGANSNQPIQALDPDFVISIQYPVEKDEPVANKNLELLLLALYDHGFFAQIRPQDKNSLLIFIKLGTSAFQQALTNDLLKNFEFGVPSSKLTPSERLRIVYQVLASPPSIGGIGIKSYKFVNGVIPITLSLSLFKDLTFIQDVQLHTLATTNTELIKEKYGTKVAFYFEYLKYYIMWLGPLSVFGFISSLKLKNRFSMTYTIFNLAWGILFLTFWNRKERYLSNAWGVENSHLVDDHYSELAKLNARKEDFKSTNTRGVRFVKEFAFIPIALLFAATLITYQLTCFVLEIFLSEIYDGPLKPILTLIPTILISVFVPVLTIIYNKVADAHIGWELHDNDYSRANSALVKLFVLTFLTSYMPLLITSFVYLPFAHLIKPNLNYIEDSIIANVEAHLGIDNGRQVHRYLARLKSQEDFQYNQERLNAQFFYFIVTNQIIQVILKYALPFIIKFVIKQVETFVLKKEQFKAQDRDDEKEFLENVRKVVVLPEYNANDDFRALCVQYGYLIIFGPVWSLAPLASVIFNVITFKLDVLKLKSGKYFQPPIPQRVDSIHPWKHVIFGLTWLALIISPILTSFYRHGTKPAITPSPPSVFETDIVADAMGDVGRDEPTGGRRHRHRHRGGRRGGSPFSIQAACVHGSCLNLITTVFLSEHFFFLSYFLLSKLSQLFKSAIENANDNTINDVKLRREYYNSSKPAQIFEKSDIYDGLWEQYGFEKILKQAQNLNHKTAEKEKVHAEPFKFQDEKLSSVQAELEKVKDAQDKIIHVTDGKGNILLATIDDNQHFVPPADSPKVVAGDSSTHNSFVENAPVNHQ